MLPPAGDIHHLRQGPDILQHRTMDILVEPSEYRFLNAGDSAMTQVAISRLCGMWPEAHIRVLTNHPELLPSYSAKVVPLSHTGRRRRSTVGSVVGAFSAAPVAEFFRVNQSPGVSSKFSVEGVQQESLFFRRSLHEPVYDVAR
jgi:hypothetical protein